MSGDAGSLVTPDRATRVAASRRGPGRVRRTITGMIAAALVPILVVTTQGTAQAVGTTLYGPWMPFSAMVTAGGLVDAIPSLKEIDNAECTADMRYALYDDSADGGAAVLSLQVRNGRCFSGPATFWNNTMTVSITATGAESSGAACTTTAALSANRIENTYSGDVIAFESAPATLIFNSATCAVTQVRIEVQESGGWFDQTALSKTVDVPLGDPPRIEPATGPGYEGSPECGWATGGVFLVRCTDSQMFVWLGPEEVTWVNGLPGPNVGTHENYGGFSFWNRDDTGIASNVRWYWSSNKFPENGGEIAFSRPAAGSNPMRMKVTRTWVDTLTTSPYDDVVHEGRDLTLVGYFTIPAQGGTVSEPPAEDDLGGGDTAVDGSPEDAPPPAPKESPSVGDSSACGFDWRDPTTYAGAGICRLVELMRTVIKTIAAVPGAIADFFVPAPGALDAKVKGLSDAWAASPPGVYVDAFGDVAAAAKIESGGCAGPRINTELGPLGHIDATPLSACEGSPLQGIATIFRIGLMLLLYVGAALAGLRVLGSSIGLNVNGVGGSAGAE